MAGAVCAGTCGMLGLSGCVVGCLAVVGTTSAPAGIGCVAAAAVGATSSAIITS